MEASKQEFFNWVLIQLVKLVTKFFVFKALRSSVSWAVEMEASKQEFFNWVLIQLVKLVTKLFFF